MVPIARRLSPLLVLAALVLAGSPARAGGPEPGERAPEIEIKEFVTAKPFKLADCENEVVVLLFTQTNVPDVDAQMKEYAKLIETRGDKGLRFLAISRENRDQLALWADENKVTVPLAQDGGSWKGAYGVDGYPFVYVIDVYGEVAWKGDGNRPEQVRPQVDKCLKEVKRISLPRAETGKSFERIWRALDKNEWPNAIKWCEMLRKGKDEEDAKDAEQLLGEISAIADGRLARVEELEKRKDYVSGEAILRGVEKTFAGLPQGKAAKEKREAWLKTKPIKDELDSAKLYEQGKREEEARQFRRAAELYRAAMAFPGTKWAAKANGRLAELIKKGLAK